MEFRLLEVMNEYKKRTDATKTGKEHHWIREENLMNHNLYTYIPWKKRVETIYYWRYKRDGKL